MAVPRSVHCALAADLPPGWYTQPDHLHDTEPDENPADPTPARNTIRLRSAPGELTPWRKEGALELAGPVNGDAAGAKPHVAGYVGQGAARPAPAGMVPNRHAHHRKIPLPCHLRVTPSPSVRSYRPHIKETQPPRRPHIP